MRVIVPATHFFSKENSKVSRNHYSTHEMLHRFLLLSKQILYYEALYLLLVTYLLNLLILYIIVKMLQVGSSG